jgi:hypothetical protein
MGVGLGVHGVQTPATQAGVAPRQAPLVTFCNLPAVSQYWGVAPEHCVGVVFGTHSMTCGMPALPALPPLPALPALPPLPAPPAVPAVDLLPLAPPSTVPVPPPDTDIVVPSPAVPALARPAVPPCALRPPAAGLAPASPSGMSRAPALPPLLCVSCEGARPIQRASLQIWSLVQSVSTSQAVRQVASMQRVPSGQPAKQVSPEGIQALEPMALRQREPTPHSASVLQLLRQTLSKQP